jgi:hypothetical protein
MTTAAPSPAELAAAQRSGSSAGAPGRSRAAAGGRRTWRGPVALVALVLLGSAVIALLQPRALIIGYLDPADTGPSGTHALADILATRGTTVVRTITPAAAQAAVAQAGGTLLVTSPSLLTARQLAGLALLPGNRVLVQPDPAALAALAPAVTLAGVAPVGPVRPGCGLTAARLAGTADMGGLRLRVTAPGAVRCYPVSGSPSLVQYAAGRRVITVLGTGLPLADDGLPQLGNAALALNLLGTSSRVVWLVPGPGLPAAPAAGSKSLLSLIPLPAYMVMLQLAIATAAAALWRGRRLGPLVPERLPAVVRAAETVEGHARLYQSRRARDRAASALRTATLRRTGPLLGLPPAARADAVVQALAGRSRRDPAEIEALLFGPAPGDDRALTAFAADLDALEREVRAQ